MKPEQEVRVLEELQEIAEEVTALDVDTREIADHSRLQGLAQGLFYRHWGGELGRVEIEYSDNLPRLTLGDYRPATNSEPARIRIASYLKNTIGERETLLHELTHHSVAKRYGHEEDGHGAAYIEELERAQKWAEGQIRQYRKAGQR